MIDELPVPHGVAMLRAFLNTLDAQTGHDDLATDTGTTRWLTRQRLVPPGTQFDERDRARLLEVREALSQVVAGNGGDSVDRRAVTTLNEAARRIRLGVRLHPDDGYRMIAEGPGMDRPIGELLLRVMGSINAGTWARLKLCANPDCGQAFYDSSRNRSGRWCSMARCGNRMKGRAYRRRVAETAGRTPASRPVESSAERVAVAS